MEDGATDVRIQDLPYYVTDEELKEAMAIYGEIISIRELRYPAGSKLEGILTGVRIVRMLRSVHINSFVRVCGELTGVFYQGQPKTCRYCSFPAHNGVRCATNRQKRAAEGSFADVLKRQQQKQPALSATKPTMTPKSRADTTLSQATNPKAPGVAQTGPTKNANIAKSRESDKPATKPAGEPATTAARSTSPTLARTRILTSESEKCIQVEERMAKAVNSVGAKASSYPTSEEIIIGESEAQPAATCDEQDDEIVFITPPDLPTLPILTNMSSFAVPYGHFSIQMPVAQNLPSSSLCQAVLPAEFGYLW
uniref:Uncharacterized protein n=1 Tax=Anopheles atroparvus TaxID=41427 RepID=A0A182IYK3_ANOAO